MPLNHAVLDDQRAAEKPLGVNSAEGIVTHAHGKMAENDDSWACRFDQDPVSTRDDISNVAAAAVDSERTGDGHLAVVAAAEAIDLGDAALGIGSRECGARRGRAAGVAVAAGRADP